MSKRGEGNRKKVLFSVTFSLQPVPASNSLEGWKRKPPLTSPAPWASEGKRMGRICHPKHALPAGHFTMGEIEATTLLLLSGFGRGGCRKV